MESSRKRIASTRTRQRAFRQRPWRPAHSCSSSVLFPRDPRLKYKMTAFILLVITMKNWIASALCGLLAACGGSGQGTTQLLPSGPAQLASFQSITFEGDSLVAVSGSTSWPTEIVSRWQVTSANFAVSGATTTAMLNRYPTDRANFPAGKGLFIINGGTNDIANGCKPADTYANLKSLWKLARGDGLRIIAFTVRSWPADTYCETQRNALNSLIKSDTSLYDGLIDTDQLFPNRDDRNLLSDGTHYTPSANILVAVAVQTALERLK